MSKISESAKRLNQKILKDFERDTYSLGFNELHNKFILYEHKENLEKYRTLTEFEGFPVEYKFIGEWLTT